MADRKIKIDSALFAQLGRVAEVAGYATTEEFIIHILESTANQIPEDADEALIHKQLQGLGYVE